MSNFWSSHWQQEIKATSDLLVILFKEMELCWAMKPSESGLCVSKMTTKGAWSLLQTDWWLQPWIFKAYKWIDHACKQDDHLTMFVAKKQCTSPNWISKTWILETHTIGEECCPTRFPYDGWGLRWKLGTKLKEADQLPQKSFEKDTHHTSWW